MKLHLHKMIDFCFVFSSKAPTWSRDPYQTFSNIHKIEFAEIFDVKGRSTHNQNPWNNFFVKFEQVYK
jgi:hypothetical protein